MRMVGLRFGCLAFGALAVGACEPGTPSSPPPVVTLSPPEATTSDAEPSAPEPSASAEAARIACSLQTDDLQTKHRWHLRLAAEGAEAVQVSGGIPATLELADGPRASVALLTARGEEAVLRGWVAPSNVGLTPARPLTVAGMWVPYPWSPLPWEGSDGRGKLRVAPPEETTVRTPEPVVDTVDCEAVTIGPHVYFEPVEALPGPAGDRFGALTSDRVALSTTPGGPPQAIVEGRAGGAVWILEQAGAHQRIALAGDHALVFGWVDGGAVKPGTQRAARPGTGGSWLRGGSRALPRSEERRCRGALPLILRVGDERGPIGHLQPDVVIQVATPFEPPTEPWRQVRVRDARWFALEGGAELLASADALKACAPLTSATTP
ncbi:MAG: hypothetical protein R3B72_19425 [Polyangiaceae bacterium]